MTIVAALGFVIFGAFAGAVLLAFWWIQRFKDTENVNEFVKGLRSSVYLTALPRCPFCDAARARGRGEDERSEAEP